MLAVRRDSLATLDRMGDDPAVSSDADLRRLLDVRTIHLQPGVEAMPTGRQILARFPDAERIEVDRHQLIPGLHGNEGNAERWMAVKRHSLVLGVLASPRVRPNGRSADFIAPSLANGCAMACAYCYVPRRKGYANPITVYCNTERILSTLSRHADRQGPKATPNQCDPDRWVYDLGENSDASVDALLSDATRQAVEMLRDHPHAKASFATKYVNRDLLAWDPRQQRIRFSLMPARMAGLLDLRTSPIAERIAAVNDFVDAGWEVHLNFSPVVLHEGWRQEWVPLLTELADVLSPAARAQLAAEVIMLTHNAALHEVNTRWHPRAEEVLWRPDIQEEKQSRSGQVNVRYRTGWKGQWVRQFRDLVDRHLPGCRIRYAF